MSKNKEKLMIIDGNAIIHRSFHALPPTMRTKDGVLVNAVYGFSSFLLKAWKELKPDYIVLTLDMKGPTFRHEKYKEYKATRVKAPDDLYAQIPLVKKIATAFNIPIFELSGFEADDLIGTIARQTDEKVEKIIVTGDMDTMQLVNAHTKVFAMGRGLSESVLYDAEKVKERFGGLGPEQMIDYKALRGDPSDNIPGVKGIGEKTATELLKEFGTLENLYSKLKITNDKFQIRPRIIELLKEHKDEAYLSKDLSTINTEAPIKFELEKCRAKDFNIEEVSEVFSQLEFKSLLPRVQEIVAKSATGEEKIAAAEDKFARDRAQFDYQLVDDEKKFEAFLKKLGRQKYFTVDTETTGLDPLTCQLLGISFSWEEGIAFYVSFCARCHSRPVSQYGVNSGRNPGLVGKNWIPGQARDDKKEVLLCHSGESRNPELIGTDNTSKSRLGIYPVLRHGNRDDKKEQSSLFNYQKKEAAAPVKHPWLEKLKPILENPEIKKSGHNIKYDWRVLRANGIELSGVEFDSMVASYLLNPGSRAHSLDSVVFAEFGFEKISQEDLIGSGKNKIAYEDVSVEKMAIYSCEDADFTQRLVKKLDKELGAKKSDKLFYELEVPLIYPLTIMEDNGVKLDVKFLADLSKKLNKKIKVLEKNIWDLAGGEFNVSSTQQLKEVLFEKLNISTLNVSKTKTGFSTAADELEKLKNEHEIIPLIQEYRELAKLESTYVSALPELVNKKSGRVHASFNQTITATGRLSSSDPNLQNIPIRTELGQEIRKAFIAEPGWKIVSLDYSQIELRLAAHLSGDKKMIEFFASGLDIHTATAAAINNVPLEKVTKEMRREAKAINFGILYGQGAYGLSQTADIPYARAKEFIREYFAIFEDVKKYTEDMVAFAREHGYVETMFGRRRYLPEINSQIPVVRAGAERMAVNTPLQGTNADMTKKAMILIQELIEKKYKDKVKMIIQVHDELVFEMKDEVVAKASTEIAEIMKNVLKLKVPVVVDAEAGESWGSLEKI